MSVDSRNGYYSKKIMEAVKAHNDIVDVINEYTPLTGSNGKFHGNNPFSGDQAQSLVVSQSEQLFQCIDTGDSGDVFVFVMKADNLSLNQTIEKLSDRANIKLPVLKDNNLGKAECETVLQINKEAARYYYNTLISAKGKHGLDYFHNARGLTDRTITRFGLGFAENRTAGLYSYLSKKGFTDEQIQLSGLVSFYKNSAYDKFRNRVMCPIINPSGNVVGFSGRVLDDSKPKYINSPETIAYDKKLNLYGLNFIPKTKKQEMILCEGNLDVISMHQAGFRYTVAPLGTAFTKEQAELISSYANHVHLMFDSDKAGYHAAQKAIPMLKEHGINVDIVHLEPYKDPDEFLKAEGVSSLQKRIDEAENSYFFETRMWVDEYDLSSPEGQQQASNDIAQKLMSLPSEDRSWYAEHFRLAWESKASEFQISTNGINVDPSGEPESDSLSDKTENNDYRLNPKELLDSYTFEPCL